MSLTAPAFFTAACARCETYRTFVLEDGDSDDAIARYECEDCDHVAVLDLDP